MVRAGTTITGNVVADFQAPMPLLSIKVRIVGVQTIVDPQKASDIAETATSTRFFEHEQQCWASVTASVTASGHDAVAQQPQELSGHMCFSFEIQLPADLPASFMWLGPDQSSASVEYKIVPLCISSADGRTAAGVRSHAQPFKMLEALDLQLLMTSASSSTTKKLKFDGGGSSCECALQLPRALLFAGESIPVIVSVSNKSR